MLKKGIYVIKKENLKKVKEIFKDFKFEKEKIITNLELLVNQVSYEEFNEQYENYQEFNIVEFGKISSNKPETYYLTTGFFEKKDSNSKRTLNFRINTANGDIIHNYDIFTSCIILIEKQAIDMDEKEFEVLACYNRECDLNDDFHKIFKVVSTTKENALDLVDSYSIENMFDDIEKDYIEDSLYAVRVLSEHPIGK